MINHVRYALRGILGQECVLTEVNPHVLGLRLPALAERQFVFYQAKARGTKKIVLCVFAKEKLPLRIIDNNYQRLLKQFGGSVLFYFTELTTRNRQWLARRKVQFMVADRFLHAPLLGIIGETKDLITKREDLVEPQVLTPAAETILIGQILDERYKQLSGKEIADAIGLTPAATSKALQELEGMGFLQLKRTGKSKSADFEDRDILWYRSYYLLRNPVEAELWVDELPQDAINAGVSALATISMLAEPEVQTFAVCKRGYENYVNDEIVINKEHDETTKLQLWRRDPKVLSTNNVVDPISLYLSLKADPDERTQKELSELLERHGLKVPNGDY